MNNSSVMKAIQRLVGGTLLAVALMVPGIARGTEPACQCPSSGRETGIPLLSKIPYLGKLFKNVAVDVSSCPQGEVIGIDFEVVSGPHASAPAAPVCAAPACAGPNYQSGTCVGSCPTPCDHMFTFFGPPCSTTCTTNPPACVVTRGPWPTPLASGPSTFWLSTEQMDCQACSATEVVAKPKCCATNDCACKCCATKCTAEKCCAETCSTGKCCPVASAVAKCGQSTECVCKCCEQKSTEATLVACPALARKHHGFEIFEQIVELSADNAALAVTVESLTNLQEERMEMMEALAELAIEKAKLEVEVAHHAKSEATNSQMLELLVENAHLKAKAEFDEQKLAVYREAMQIAIENEKLKLQLADWQAKSQSGVPATQATRPVLTEKKGQY